MNFVEGATRWHVLGWPGGDEDSDPVLLCGRPFDRRAYSGGFYEVTHSSLRLCRTCDRATSGSATESVRDYFELEQAAASAGWYVEPKK